MATVRGMANTRIGTSKLLMDMALDIALLPLTPQVLINLNMVLRTDTLIITILSETTRTGLGAMPAITLLSITSTIIPIISTVKITRTTNTDRTINLITTITASTAIVLPGQGLDIDGARCTN